MNASRWTLVAALLAGLGVVSGAFGAHALEERLVAAGMLGTWETAVRYQMWHALALFAWSLHAARAGAPASRPGGAPGWCFLVGTLCFSGSLYGLCLLPEGGLRSALGPVTPLGGGVLIVGWAILAVSAARSRRSAP